MSFFSLRPAISALIIAVLLATSAAVRAVLVEPVQPVPAPSSDPVIDDPAVHRRAVTEPDLIGQIAANNPFHPERRRGGTYQLPGRTDDPRTVAIAAAPTNGDVRLLGTAVGGTGADFVVCAVGREAPRIVRVGARCGQLLLQTVARGSATFTDPAGERVDLEVPKAGSQ